MKQSFLQKVYSFFGFSSYNQCIDDDKAYKVVYWCCLPWGKFFRNFDLFTIDVSSTKSISAQNQEFKRSKTTWILIPIKVEYWEDIQKISYAALPTIEECTKCLKKAKFSSYDDAYNNIDYEGLFS